MLMKRPCEGRYSEKDVDEAYDQGFRDGADEASNEMKDLLFKLGFVHITGNVWTHEETGVIQFRPDSSQNDIVKKIKERGYGECQNFIRGALGIENEK